MSVEQKLDLYADTSGGAEACWLWRGPLTDRGYGCFKHNAKHTLAHRAMWARHRGAVPEGLGVLHNCPGGDNRRCCNPAHMFLGTRADNNADMCKKGRQPRGQKIARAKLSAETVRAIRGDQRSMTEVAREIGVTLTAVSDAKNRRSWKHVE